MKPHLICCSAHSSNSLNLTKPLALLTLFFCLLSLLFLALTSNPTPTTTLPPDSPISPAYLTDLSHSNAIAFAQSQVAAYTSNIINSVTNRIPTYHLLTTYHFAPSHTLPDPSVVSYLAHNDPITTQELRRYISRLSELLDSGVIDSATLTLSPASTSTPNNP